MKRCIEITLLCCFSLLACTELPAQAAPDPYICPPCGNASCDKTEHETAGNCPACGMRLIKKSSMKNVAIFIYDGVEILDFSGPGEVFAATHSDQGAMRVYTVAASKEPVISQGFVQITPEFSIADCPKPDIIVLPGGSTGATVNNPEVINWIKSVAPDLYAAVSVCTGAYILQKTGLLDGKKATTWHGALENFRQTATQTEVLENTRWVDNGQMITTAGVSAGIDGALRVVEKLYGRQVAAATARYMEYDKWHPEDGIIVEDK